MMKKCKKCEVEFNAINNNSFCSKSCVSQNKHNRIKPAWNKNLTKKDDPRLKGNTKPRTPEQILKIKETIRKKYANGYVNPFKGKHHTEKTKNKILETKRKYYEEHPEQKRIVRNKISNTLKEYYRNNINAKKKCGWSKGLTKETDIRVEKGAISKLNKPTWNKNKTNIYSKETLCKMGWSKGLTKETNSSLMQMSLTMASRKNKKISKKELIILKIIKEITNNFIHNGQIGYYNPDFIFENRKKIIEFNGCYWHACKICKPKLRENTKSNKGVQHNLIIEKRRTTYLKNKGYKILFLWEHELDKNKEEIKQKIKEFLK